MTIEGVNILSQKIVFEPTWYGIIAWILFLSCSALFAIIFFEEFEIWTGIVALICGILWIIFFILNITSSGKTFCNQPTKIEYTIEIIDDNAWKELGPNYTLKEKVYENKEIYIVEGDYVE